MLCQDVAKAILAEYGGAATLEQMKRLEVTGRLGGGALDETFTLKISGENSRFETAHYRAIRNGGFAQSGPADRALPKARRTSIGLEQTLIFPVAMIARLADSSFEYAGRSDGAYFFKGHIERGGFIGYSPPPIGVELAFDAETLLLRSIVFSCVDDTTLNLAMTYGDYTEVQGLPVATTVTRWSRDGPLQVVTIETVDLNPKFTDENVRLVEEGGRK